MEASEKVQKIVMLGYGLIANNPIVIQRTKHMAGETARQFCLDVLEKVLVDEKKGESMKKELVTIQNNNVVVSSLDVANNFHKRHDKLLSEIERMYGEYSFGEGLPKMVDTPLFFKRKYIHPQNGQEYTEYLMNRDGFSLLVMGFTGKKSLEWKMKYIKAFNAMEERLKERQTPAYIEARQTGKLVRREFTDVLQQLEGYAKAQGSRNHGRFYGNYTRFINKILGVHDRETATTMQLLQIQQLENITGKFVLNCMNQKIHYKEIYPRCKQHLSQFMAYINGEPLRLTA